MLGPSLRSKEKKVESNPACALHYIFLSIPKLTSQKDCVEALKYVPLDQPSLASHCVGIQQALALATKHAATRRNMAETHSKYRLQSELPRRIQWSSVESDLGRGCTSRIFFDNVTLLFDLSLYVPSTIFQKKSDGSSWVEPVLS